MAGRIVTNEKTGEQAWWDGQNLMPVSGPDDPMVKAFQQEDANKAHFDQQMAGNEVMRQAKQRSVQEAGAFNQSMIKNVAVPLAQTAAGVATGGMSLPAQAGLGMALEGALQAYGLSPDSGGAALAQGAIPFVGKGVQTIGKGLIRSVANVSGKGQKAGEQAIAKRLGATEDVVERAYETPKSKALYEAAEQGGPLPTSNAQAAIREAFDAEKALGSQADKATLKMLQGIEKDLEGGIIDAPDAIAKAQRLGGKAGEAFKRGVATKGKTLKTATEGFKETIPGVKEADVAYTREQAVDEVFKSIRKSNKVKALDDLLVDPKKGDRIKAAIAPDEMRDIRKIASQIMDMGSQANAGSIMKAHEGTVRSFLSDPNGLTVFRHAFGPDLGKMTPQGVAGLLTFMRAYQAQTKKGK